MERMLEGTKVYEGYEPINGGRGEINWDEVENKVAILVRKFSNIDSRYRDDLAQELRLHAMLKSDDFYDLQRRAIDFWRSIQRKVYPEVPFIDLELVGGSLKDKAEESAEFSELLSHMRRELAREGTVAEVRLNAICHDVLDIILEDIVSEGAELDEELNRYINGRINCTYLAKRLPDIHYKMIRKAVKNLEDILDGLYSMRHGHSFIEA